MIKPKSLNALTLFFPCYNEALNISSVIEQAVKIGEDYGLDYEVLVVNDGSTDTSAEIIQSWIQKNPRVRVIPHAKNMGYGAALRTGLSNAKKDWVFLADGDNQFRLPDIEKLFSKADSCDAVVGFRIQRQDKFLRRLKGSLWTWLIQRLFSLKVSDVDCAFKLFRRKAIQDLQLKSKHLLIHAEILARLKKRGYRIEEIGVPHYPRLAGKATATGVTRIVKTFVELFTIYFQIQKEKRVC
jgi:glycosyltransferase involved in cell wall biosynthesis